mgnify:CR=1 FL=1
MRKAGKRLPKTQRVSRGPIEDVGGQNKAAAMRPNARKRKNFAPPAGSVPPQPFAPPVGAPVPV